MNATVMTTGPGRDHRHGDGVQELVLGQPAVLLDDALVEERHDRQAAAEDERAGLGEEEQDLQQDVLPRRRPLPDHAAISQATARSRRPARSPARAASPARPARSAPAAPPEEQLRQLGLETRPWRCARTAKMPQSSGSRLFVERASL